MLKLPSVQREYTFIHSADSALDLPEDAEARTHALKVARETGTYPLKSGEVPTLFQLHPLSRDEVGWFMGEAAHSSELGRPLSALEMDELAVRLALVKIDNAAVKVERKRHGQVWLATRESTNAIAQCLPEIAGHVIERAQDVLRPLS